MAVEKAAGQTVAAVAARKPSAKEKERTEGRYAMHLCYECKQPILENEDYAIIGMNYIHAHCYDKYAGTGSFKRLETKMKEWRRPPLVVESK